MYITITLTVSALIYQTLITAVPKVIINVMLNDVNAKCPGNVLFKAQTHFVNIEPNEL